MSDIQLMALSVGVISMLWRILDKYEVVTNKVMRWLNEKLSTPLEICVMCITFWFHLLFFLTCGHGLMSIVLALGCTPFTLELTKSIWQ
jgi:hypothetical protein